MARVRDNVVWTYWDNRPYFSGEVEPCINGMVLALAASFGELGAGDGRLLGRLLDEQLEDGGWNCQAPDHSRRSSFHTTISVLEGLWEYERAAGPDPAVTAARSRGEEYLLTRQLFRRLSTGEVINPDWTLFSFPPRWYYDVLRGLDYFRCIGAAPDERCREGIELVRGKRHPDGRWPLENPHEGDVHFDIDAGPGKPSRWNTLRALRVLRWYDRTRFETAVSAVEYLPRGTGVAGALHGAKVVEHSTGSVYMTEQTRGQAYDPQDLEMPRL